jgi:hypothetical protein
MQVNITSKQLWIAAIVVAVLLVVGVLGRDWLSARLEKFNQWRFQRAVAEQRAETDKVKAENVKLLAEMKQVYALGQAKELERDAAYAELAKYGEAAKKAVEAQQEAAKQYEADQSAIAVDISLFKRCHNLCASRAEVGYPCKPNPDAYCSKYAGR